MEHKKMTYNEAYDKIINAYFKNEIKPMKSEFCFCGTLAPDKNWTSAENYPYTIEEYNRMEKALLLDGSLSGIIMNCLCVYRNADNMEKNESYEDALFEGMCKALDVLKQIHIERGEIIDEPSISFTKRELQTI